MRIRAYNLVPGVVFRTDPAGDHLYAATSVWRNFDHEQVLVSVKRQGATEDLRQTLALGFSEEIWLMGLEPGAPEENGVMWEDIGTN